MCKITVVHNLITFRTSVSLLHYCKGYYTVYPPKVPGSGP